MLLELINSEFHFSYYSNIYAVKESDNILDINQLIEIIKYGHLKDVITKLRTVTEKTRYDKIKKSEIPCVTLSGVFSERNYAHIIEHSGLIQIDIDHLEDRYDDVWKKIILDEYTYVCFRSPGGKGIKIVVKIAPDENTHLDQFNALEKYYKEEYEIVIDPACKDVSRSLLLSHDPDLFCNPFSEVYAELYQPPEIEVKEYKNVSIQLSSVQKNDVIEEIINELELSKVDITDSYENWMRVGFALSSEFGESGRGYFHRLSQFHSDYNSVRCDKQFDSLVSRPPGKITLGTIIFIAREHGVDVKVSSYQKKQQKTVDIKKTSIETFGNDDKELYDSLRKLRLDLSHKNGMKAYMVFSNSTLNQLVKDKPKSELELLNCKGFGQKKVDWFGEEIINVIKQE